MDQQARRAGKPLVLRSYLLLVLAVLVGLVAMHGLGPGAVAASADAPGCAAAAHGAAVAHGMPAAGEHTVRHDPAVRADGPAGDGSGGHIEHADATCAATGTAGAPVLPSPAAAPGGVADVPVLGAGTGVSDAVGGRAPPSLSELQLLRI
ncbi:DUF6153 family protein [Streptomyces xanthophaeus]|uniref:DUF6153 family protein n=1 Tax=Streptomyces xanthophaeus TaxID=67385 RepID=UPI0026487F31|nr:DUF6153 family protein [Streptomyces xanthophaeus]WKD35983.1 hypothetical protein KO717_31240 [Streptomyces xanthophaeus]